MPSRSEVTAGVPGNVNFNLRFIPKAAALMRPLLEDLKRKAPKHLVDWSLERDSAFIDAKKALANAIMLAHPSPDESIAITIDASDCCWSCARTVGVWCLAAARFL